MYRLRKFLYSLKQSPRTVHKIQLYSKRFKASLIHKKMQRGKKAILIGPFDHIIIIVDDEKEIVKHKQQLRAEFKSKIWFP